MDLNKAAIILSKWQEGKDISSFDDVNGALRIALIILIAFNNTLKEVSK